MLSPTVARARWRDRFGEHPLAFTALAASLAVVVARVPFLTLPATPDEGGFLLVASQWHRGSSLYGDHWVDRPPLIIAIHSLADQLGGTVALRVIGMVCAVAVVVMAAVLTHMAAREDRSATLTRLFPVPLAALLVSTPLFGASEVPGELLTAPFVLGGVLALIAASRRTGRPALAWSALAGVLAVAAVGVKQNAVDVVVAAVLVALPLLRRYGVRFVLSLAAAFSVGALAFLAVGLGAAAWRGTDIAGLWDAVVTFRVEASRVIDASAPPAVSGRAVNLFGAFVLSLLPVVLLALLWRVRHPLEGRLDPDRPREWVDLRYLGVGLLAWEVVGVVLGGSYWLHYLLLLVPGSVVLAAASAQRPATRRADRGLAATLGLALVSLVAAHAASDGMGPARTSDARPIAYLRANAAPGDTATAAFGHPDILWESGLDSPYRELWSLPVRVRDSKLARFTSLLESERAPTWIVVHGDSLRTWGVETDRAQQVLEQRYGVAAVLGEWRIWRLR